MKRRLLILSLALGCSTGGTGGPGIDVLMRDYGGAVPGAGVLVVRDGSVVLREIYGLADLEKNVPASPQTNYRLASVTKQFTAAAILLLADRGRISLDDAVEHFLAGVPPGITLRHLLTHTSGLIDYEELIPEGTTAQLMDRDVLELLRKVNRTYFAPGGSYRYSNTGYALLALIVEKVSGRTFATFLHDEIFLPLSMENTVAFENGVSSVANRAFGYSRRDGGWERTDQSLTSAVLGDGGIYSSIDDLARWNEALEKSRLLRPETWQLAFTPSTPTDDPAVQYGFGWRVGTHRGHRTLWHSGETRGFRNVLLRFPDDRLTVVVLTNRNDPPPYSTALAIADLYLNR